MSRNSLIRWCLLAALTISQMGLKAKAIDIVISSFEPAPTTENGFVQIQAGDKASNQFTLTNNLDPTGNSIDRIQILYDIDTPLSYLDKVKVSINKEVIVQSGSNLVPEPGAIVQVPNPPSSGPLVNLVFDKIVETGTVTLDNKDYLLVSYDLDGSPTQIFPPGPLSGPVNYWLVVSNENSDGNVSWAKTKTTDPIYNNANPLLASASISPNTLNFNQGAWQHPGGGGGDGNQIMLFALVHAPEPSTYVLGSVMTGVLAMVGRSKARRGKPALKPVA